MFTGASHPGIRAAIGVILLVIGLALHRPLFGIAGGATLVLSAGQWLYGRRGTRR